MKYKSRTILITLVAIVALSGIAAGSASAAFPEFAPGTSNAFTGKGGEAIFQEATGGIYSCTLSTITGEIVSAKEVSKVIIKFRGTGGGCATFCRNGFEPEFGTLETKELKGRIAYITKPGKRVGLLLEPVAQPIATCEHSSIPGAKLKGSIMAEIGPVNLSRKIYTLTYTQNGGKQDLMHFEGEELLHQLAMEPNGLGSREVGLGTKMELTTTKAIEIEA
jgi:hypothetical protein